MELVNNPDDSTAFTQKEKISFSGNGATYFGIVALNVVLTIITVGLYYPWAKAAYRKYLWNESEFKGSRFVFNGTGREMFKGFLIAYLIILGFYGLAGAFMYIPFGYVLLGIAYLLILALIPFAIFGAWRYRISRTSWRGIFFSFDGDFREFLKLFIKGIILTLLTLGIYGAWMRVSIQQYLFSHTKIGDLRLDFHGKGEDLLIINIGYTILSYITLFILLPLFIKKRFEFSINNTTLSNGMKTRHLNSTLSNSTAWTIMFTNLLLIVFTAGLAFPWVIMRSMKMYFDHTEIPGVFDYDNLSQSPTDYRDATGDEMTDILDIGLDF